MERLIEEEIGHLLETLGEAFDEARCSSARDLLIEIALGDDFPEFLTLAAYELLA